MAGCQDLGFRCRSDAPSDVVVLGYIVDERSPLTEDNSASTKHTLSEIGTVLFRGWRGFYFFKTTGFCSYLPEMTSSQKAFSLFSHSFPKVVLKKPPSFSKTRFHPGR